MAFKQGPFRTASDFRKDNLKPIKKVFKSLNK